MQNLTQHLRVVGTELAGIQPQVGWHLVILRQSGKGRVLVKHLGPGEKFRPFSFGTSSFISIPVTGNGRLVHEFTSSVSHVSPGHSFEADYVLHFSVFSHKIVAIRWTEDPVRRVEEQIKRVVDAITRVTNWEKLRDSILADAGASDFHDTVADSVDNVQPFANDYGIQVDKIRMTLRLSKTEAGPDEQEAELARARRSIEARKQRELAETTAKHEVKVQEAHQTAQLESIDTFGKLRARTANHLDRALGQVADNTTDAVTLVRNVQIIDGLSTHGLLPHPSTPGSAPSQPLLGAARPNRLALAVEELTMVIDTMGGDQARKRELACNLLHLMAEAWREKEAAVEVADKYAAAAAELLGDWKRLSPDQFSTLNRFAQFRELQEMLK